MEEGRHWEIIKAMAVRMERKKHIKERNILKDVNYGKSGKDFVSLR